MFYKFSLSVNTHQRFPSVEGNHTESYKTRGPARIMQFQLLVSQPCPHWLPWSCQSSTSPSAIWLTTGGPASETKSANPLALFSLRTGGSTVIKSAWHQAQSLWRWAHIMFHNEANETYQTNNLKCFCPSSSNAFQGCTETSAKCLEPCSPAKRPRTAGCEFSCGHEEKWLPTVTKLPLVSSTKEKAIPRLHIGLRGNAIKHHQVSDSS